MEMVEWDDTCGSGTGKVGGGALMMTVVSAPAISARTRVGAIAAGVPWVLAVALEAVQVGRKVFFSFAQQ